MAICGRTHCNPFHKNIGERALIIAGTISPPTYIYIYISITSLGWATTKRVNI